MSFNGSGTFVINSTGQPVVTGTVISSTAFNALTADLATGLSTTMTKDGQTTATANIPMGSFKFTGLSAGSAATDSANIAQVQNSFGSFLTVSGTDTITATVSPSLTAYASGQMFAFVAANTNTGAVTINISSLGAKAITKNGNTALVAGDLTANYLFVVVYDGTQFQVVGVSATTFTNLTISGVLTLSGAGVQMTSSGTGAWKMPVGTTAQRPTGADGLMRKNSTTGFPEWYDPTSAAWIQFNQGPSYSGSYLAVAGGGGGGGYAGGGGGAGGLISNTYTFASGTAYTIIIGSGGVSAPSYPTVGGSGVNTTISGIGATAVGGGGGTGLSAGAATSGGSGGGGAYSGNTAGASGTSGQGYAGGAGNGTGNYGGGGGGGAGAVGGTTSVGGGNGGIGVSSSISGSATYYAGGGGGGSITAPGPAGTGGSGGGGAGSIGNSTNGTAGSANTGGGGGGSGGNGNAANGGSGIVIISYLGSQRGTGGTVTSSGGYTIHTFTSSATYIG